MKLKTLCVFLFMLFALPYYGKADILMPLEPPIIDGESDPDYSKRKIPPVPIMCFIDFEVGTVSFNSTAIGEIEEYQICNESGETCIGSYDDLAEFVSALSSIDGDLCIRFLSPKGYYTGYITK